MQEYPKEKNLLSYLASYIEDIAFDKTLEEWELAFLEFSKK
jgi:hypothetical protein